MIQKTTQIKERPILFSTPMVQAILAGRKTQTRRIIKPNPGQEISEVYEGNGLMWIHDEAGLTYSCPYGKPGDVIWVRETWRSMGFDSDTHQMQIQFKADEKALWFDAPADYLLYAQAKYKPSIHILKDFSRIYLRIKDVRVERLQDISDESSIAEGIKHSEGNKFWLDYEAEASGVTQFIYKRFFTAKESFKSLWKCIHGQQSWRLNPWVWVVEFEVLSTSGRPNVLPEL